MFLGAEGEMLENCVRYGRIILVALPFLMLQYAFSSLSVTAEKPKLGLIVTIVSGILNMTGDALFMGVFRWGIAGAAMASAMGQIVGGIVPLIYFFRKNSSSLQIRKPKWDGRALLRASTNGVSELMSNISMSIVGMLSSQQTAQHFHLFRAGGPACGKSDDGVGIIVCFPETKFHLPCQLFHDGIFHHAENLVGRRVEAKLVAILDERLPNLVCSLDGGVPNGLIQMIREQGVKLDAQKASLCK